MNAKRLVGAGGMLGLAGLALMPVSVAHAATAQTWQGTARSSALTVTVNPDVLFGVNSTTASLYSLLQQQGVLSALGATDGSLGDIKVSLDASNAFGTLNKDLSDITSAHSDSEALAVEVKLLNGISNKLATTLAPVTSATTPLLQAIQGVNPQLAQTIATVNSAITSNPLSVLQAIGININALTQADFNVAGASNVASRTVNLVDLQKAGLPSGLDLSLAPFHANAAPAALAAANGLSGAQVSADNTTTALSIKPLAAATAKLPDLNGLISSLTSLNLNQTVTAALGVVNQGTTAVQNVLAGTPLAGVAGTLVTTTTQTVNGVQTTVVNSAPLQALQAQLTSLTNSLGLLQQLQALVAGGLDVNKIVQTSGVTSTAMLHPAAGNTIESIATTKLASVDVVPLGANLPSALSSVLGTAGFSTDSSLLHVEGVAASAQTQLGQTGNNSAFRDATSSLSKVSVLGKTIVGDGGLISVDQLVQGLQQNKTIDLPGSLGQLQVVIARGLGTKLDSPTDRKSTISALDIQVNVGPNSTGLVPNTTTASGFKPHALAAGTNLVHLQLGTVASEVTVDIPGIPRLNTTQTSVPTNPTTGLFGPAALLGGAGLAGVAILMQVAPKLAARRRQDG